MSGDAVTRQPELEKRVRERLASPETSQAEALLSLEVLEAMRLADVYESVKPQEYVLPLDALAGFVTIASSEAAGVER